MNKKEIRTEKAPLPVGPYSQAVKAGEMTFISGVLPINPQTKTLITDDITRATKTIFENIDAVLKEAGLTREQIVKTTIFMKDLKNFADVNKLYGEYFADCKVMPARSTIQVAALPLGAPLEIELIAISA
jgi:2-iminobutanoate/2-iminopropanoate deaminase